MSGHRVLPSPSGTIKAWVDGVELDDGAVRQLQGLASLPFVYPHVAVMPDVHVGIGATIGSVVPSKGAIIPAAVGVDLGCGMIAQRTSLTASDLPDSLAAIRTAIERAVPHGRSANGQRGDRGAWGEPGNRIQTAWATLSDDYAAICAKHRRLGHGNDVHHLGTLGTGNHFIEICLDLEDRVWVMLHSGSRGVGNRVGTYFIEAARKRALELDRSLPDRDLAWFEQGEPLFDDYVEAVSWAQRYAATNRALMMEAALAALAAHVRPFHLEEAAVNCHHNYVQRETHFGEELWVTRKGAVRAGLGELGIIPGSMGAKSFIVRGKGNADSLCSCSHGAGRRLSRTKAKAMFSLADHAAATAGVECRKDEGVLDETPAAYKSIDAVMAAQSDLVEVVHQLRQVVCVKG
jgi:tRNA-splicing ligase RtcB